MFTSNTIIYSSTPSNQQVLSNLAVAFVYLFVISFQCGVGPIPAFITAELFDISER